MATKNLFGLMTQAIFGQRFIADLNNMEGSPNNFEKREKEIDSLIKNQAEIEGMLLDDLMSDIVTFAELFQEGEDVGSYFEILAEKIEISLEEMMQYANKKTEQ